MLAWVRDRLNNLNPEDFYKEFGYSHTARKQAEEQLQKLLSTIKEDNSSKNSRKAKRLLNTFESWAKSVNCENYWLKLETSLAKAAHQVAGRSAAYNTINTYIKIVHEDDEAFLSSARERRQAVVDDINAELDSSRKRPCPLDIVVEDNQNVPPNLSARPLSEKRVRFVDNPDEDVAVQKINTFSESSSSDSYHPEDESGNSDDTDSVISSQDKPRDRVEWLVGLGNEEWVLDEGACQWVVGDTNVTMMLMEYRQFSVQKACNDNIETAAEILSLNHIFLFEDETEIRKALDGELWKAIFNDIKAEFVTSRLSDRDLLRCHAMCNAASGTFTDCKLLLREWQRQVDRNEEDIILEFFESILQRLSLWNPRDATEDTFVHEVLAPVLSPFFDNELLICGWSTDELESSANRKKKFDPSLKGIGRKPDFTVSISVKSKKENVLITEVKSPKYRGRKLPDMIKLGNEMKDSLDKMVDDGILAEDVVVCGVLVQGLRCSLYAMDLKYDGIYRMILLGRFYLPRDHDDFGVFLRAIEILMQVKKIVLHTCNLCVKSLRMSTRVESETKYVANVGEVVVGCRTPRRQKMGRYSYHTPII